MKRACILASFLSPRDARIDKLRAALIEEGWSCDLISWVGKEGAYQTLPGATLIDWRVAANRRYWPARAIATVRGRPDHANDIARAAGQRAETIKRILAGRYELVIATDPETLVPAALAKSKSGAAFKLIYDAHEYYENEVADQPDRDAWVKKAHKMAGPHLDGFMTVNPLIADLYHTTTPSFPKAHIVHNAVPLHPLTPNDGRLAATAGLAGSQNILLFQGGIAKDRGLDLLVSALSNPPPNWHLVLLGDGQEKARLQAIAGPGVTFLPAVPWEELRHWTAGATLGAILYEPTCINQDLCSPNKLWEYPAAGVPILASNLPFLGRTVRDNNLGLTLNVPTSIDEIRSALTTYAPDVRATQQEACRKFSQTQSWQHELQSFASLLGSLGLTVR
jgi:glycosyltransferase involved in cell wall biosynthesis